MWHTIENMNVVRSRSKDIHNRSKLQLYVTVVRLGGPSYGWSIVPAALLLGIVVGIVRICTFRTVTKFEAQDLINLLQSLLQNAALCHSSKVKY